MFWSPVKPPWLAWSPWLNKIGTWSVWTAPLLLIPINKGLPLRVATVWFGYFLLLITVVQAAVKILPGGGIPGTFCFTYAKTWKFCRDCYSVNLNLGMGSGIPTIRYPNMEKYPDEFEIAETQMMIRPIRAKWFSKDSIGFAYFKYARGIHGPTSALF